MKFCSKCGTENEDTSKFCKSCGNNLTNNNTNNTTNNTNNATNNAVGMPVQYCQFCGEKINVNLPNCPKCGNPIRKVVDEKSPILSLILSFIIPGLGQLYNGQKHKFIVLLLAAIISGALVLLIIGYILYIVVWIYAMYDAYKSAEALNRGEFVEDKLFN